MLAAILSFGGPFQDHAVLQRGRPILIWGSDRPRQTIELVIEGPHHPAPVQTVTDEAGHWQLECPALPVGGPYRMRAVGSSAQTIEDLLVGDVWLAAGQSNMAFPVGGALAAGNEIASAQFPEIRVAKVPLRAAAEPVTEVPLEWRRATPQNVAAFTAVGYFFARELHRSQAVPIGIIDASWGGTRVEAWASPEGLRSVWPEIDRERERIAASAARIPRLLAEHKAAIEQWDRTALPQDTENAGEARGWAKADFDTQTWASIELPATVQSAGHPDNGLFWFRRDLDLPASAAGAEVSLELGAIDDHDRTYFNGELVGATGAETANPHETLRRYRVPGNLVRAGRNVIAVRVFDRQGLGGFMGPTNALVARFGTDSCPLAGHWRWQVERTIPKVPDSVFASYPPPPPEIDFQNQPAALFNGMIAPLTRLGLRGFIWYQGESNVGQHAAYLPRFTALIRDWRSRWGQGLLPFYFVQIANFEQNGLWPYLREAQSRALAEPETDQAITIDIGEPHDIHPRNKQEVGRRLALLARVHTYGENAVVAHGPILRRIEISGAAAIIEWHDSAGLATRDGAVEVPGFALAGADGIFHPASARIAGETVIATCELVPAPRHVRYAWADAPLTNLVNAAGLPAEPFRTDAF